jgi:hypothetical protein
METKTEPNIRQATLDMVHSISKYWTGFLRNPDSFNFDNGDTSRNGGIAMMLANISKPKSYPKEEIQNFENLLIEKLLVKRPQFIDVDYHVGGILGEVANATLTTWCNTNTFPVKTNMVINWDILEVTVSQGYTNPDKVIHHYYPISTEKLWDIIIEWKKNNYPDTPTASGCEKALDQCYAGQYPVEIAKRYCAKIYTTN